MTVSAFEALAAAILVLLVVSQAYTAVYVLGLRKHLRRRMTRVEKASLSAEARISGYPEASKLADELEELREGQAELLTRKAAEKLVENHNRLAEDFVAVRDFIESLKTQRALREQLLGAEEDT